MANLRVYRVQTIPTSFYHSIKNGSLRKSTVFVDSFYWVCGHLLLEWFVPNSKPNHLCVECNVMSMTVLTDSGLNFQYAQMYYEFLNPITYDAMCVGVWTCAPSERNPVVKVIRCWRAFESTCFVDVCKKPVFLRNNKQMNITQRSKSQATLKNKSREKRRWHTAKTKKKRRSFDTSNVCLISWDIYLVFFYDTHNFFSARHFKKKNKSTSIWPQLDEIELCFVLDITILLRCRWISRHLHTRWFVFDLSLWFFLFVQISSKCILTWIKLQL